jgi:putative ABC transport system permease protein
MLSILLRRSFLNRKKALAVMIVAVAVGTAVVSSLLALSFDISSKVSKELRSFGANIVIRPKVAGLAGLSGQKRYLREEDIVKAKTIFWRHNIEGLAPVLLVRDEGSGITLLGTWRAKPLIVPGEKAPFVTGSDAVMPWWTIEGRWPSKGDEVLAGAGLASHLGTTMGDTITLMGRPMTITGILNTGGKEDNMAVGELATVQRLAGLSGKVSTVYVSAMTTPMDDFAYKDPKTMTKVEFEKWYCTGYVTSIAKQLEEVFAGSEGRPVWPVAESEGNVLNRLNLLVYLLTAVALLAAALGVSTTMIMSLLRRTDEVALMKAIGADTARTVIIFLAESLVIGLAGGLIGYLLSLGVAGSLGTAVFGTALTHQTVLLPMSVAVAVLISLIGAYLPVRRALSIRPAVALRGGQ